MRSKHELKYIWSALETVLHSRSHLIAYAFLAFIAFIAFLGAGASAAAFFIAFFAMMFGCWTYERWEIESVLQD